MKIWIVEQNCIDPYYEPHLTGVFSTKEKAEEYISKLNDWDKANSEITEVEVDNYEL